MKNRRAWPAVERARPRAITFDFLVGGLDRFREATREGWPLREQIRDRDLVCVDEDGNSDDGGDLIPIVSWAQRIDPASLNPDFLAR